MVTLRTAMPFRYSSQPAKPTQHCNLLTANVCPDVYQCNSKACLLIFIDPDLRSGPVCLLQIIELERKAAEQGQAVRGAHVSSWANADVAPEDMYFLDSRGDRNNLVYHALYRADIAAYHRTDPGGLARGATQHHGRHNQRYIGRMCFCQ